ncbi:MAG: nitrogen fixation protein NifZ [Halothiobacillaceae bacterium]|nr:nitrogen fixation protein NifZ [Halothiobacillaceae bacterium]
MVARFALGDVVYATQDLYNEEGSGLPGLTPDALLAASGMRGVVVNEGYAEADPSQGIYLVRFEQADGRLGVPVGCLPEELTQ